MKFLTLSEGSTNAVVSTADMKNFLKVDGSADDTVIASYVKMATSYLEQYTNRAFLTSTWELSLDRKDVVGTSIELPRTPLQSIESIKTFDAEDAETTLDDSNYSADKSKQPGRVFLANGGAWPSDLRSEKAMVINFKAGWEDSIGDVDDFYKDLVAGAVMTMVAGFYDNRSGGEVPFATIPAAKPAREMLQSLRILTL